MKNELKKWIAPAVAAFALWLAVHYWDAAAALLGATLQAASPLVLGAALAYVVNILMSFYEHKLWPARMARSRARRPACLLLALGSVALVLAALFAIILPEFFRCMVLLAEKLPPALESLLRDLEQRFALSQRLPGVVQQLRSADEMLKNWLNTLLRGLGGAMGAVVSAATSVASGVVRVIVGLVFMAYLLCAKERLCRQLRCVAARCLTASQQLRVRHVLRLLDASFHSYIVGQCTEAVILGTLCALGMLLLRLPYAGMIGAMVGLTALIPVVGAYIGAAVGAFMIFTVSPVQALVFLLFLLVLQQVEGNVIYPRVVGSSLGLPGVWVLAAVTVGSGLAGVLGLVLAVPLAATAYRLLKDSVRTPSA